MANIHCKKLNQEAEALAYKPMPGKLGDKILENISNKAWQMWLGHQTILINEYRLSLIDPKAKEFLQEEMQKFLFGEGSEKPDAYTKPD